MCMIYRFSSTHFTLTCAKHIFINKISYRGTSQHDYLPYSVSQSSHIHFILFSSIRLESSSRFPYTKSRKAYFFDCVLSACDDKRVEEKNNYNIYLAYYSVLNEIRARVVVEIFLSRKSHKIFGMHSIRLLASAVVFLSAALCQPDVEVHCNYRWGGSECDCQYSDEVINFLSFFFSRWCVKLIDIHY